MFPLVATEKPPNSCKIPLAVVEDEFSICCSFINNTEEPTLLSSKIARFGVTAISPKSSTANKVPLINKKIRVNKMLKFITSLS